MHDSVKSTEELDTDSKENGVKNLPFTSYSTVFPDRGVLDYLNSILGSETATTLFWMHSKSNLDVPAIPNSSSGVGNTNRVNDIYPLNQYFRKVNVLIQKGHYFIIKLETKRDRKKRILTPWPSLLRPMVYFFDFSVTRVLPKIVITKKAYYWVTKGRNQVLSISEGLARLIFSGFDIVDYTTINGYTHVIAKKVKENTHTKDPKNGIFLTLGRVGKNREIIPVYKIRTMHPYSEYLQEYLFEKHGTRDGDKIDNDFRVTRWGRFLRKYWLDEIPMLWNWLKGDLKLIGVRPLSRHKFNTYPPDLQKKRVQFKPGMIPPYYAHLPQNLDEFFDAERIYLEAYEKHPLRTDLKYLFKSLYNIIIKGERSQ